MQGGLSTICHDIEQIIVGIDLKMQTTLENQELIFIVAFRKVQDKIKNELKQVQNKVRAYMIVKQDENAIYLEKELTFFREQSLALDALRKDMQTKNKTLTYQNGILLQQKEEQGKVLHKLSSENIKFKQMISKLKSTQVKEEESRLDLSQQTARIHSRTNSHLQNLRLKSEEQQQTIEQQSSTIEAKRYVSTHISPIKLFNRNATSRSQHHKSVDDNELHHLFKECVEMLLKEIQVRKLQQRSGKMKFKQNIRNSLNESVLMNEDSFSLKLTKLDQKNLMERFFSSTRFLDIIESKVFNIKCCQNQNCLYNNKGEVWQEIDDSPEESNKTIFLTNTNKRVDRTLIESYKPKWMERGSSASIPDQRLHYQTRLGEIKQLERDLITTPQRDKVKCRIIKDRISQVSGQLSQLSQRIRYKDLAPIPPL